MLLKNLNTFNTKFADFSIEQSSTGFIFKADSATVGLDKFELPLSCGDVNEDDLFKLISLLKNKYEEGCGDMAMSLGY